MSIEVIQRCGGLVVPEGAFFIHVEPTTTLASRVPLTEEELWADRLSQLTLPRPWAFLIGALTNKIDPNLGRLPDEAISNIVGIRAVSENNGVAVTDCYVRQNFGEKSISGDDATWLDGSAIRESDLIIAAPGFADSRNTPREIGRAAQLGKPILFLKDEKHPEVGEEDLMDWARARIAASSSPYSSMIISFDTSEQMRNELALALNKFHHQRSLRAI